MDYIGGVFGVGVLLFMLISFGIGIAAYVLTSLGLMKLAQNKGIENAWLAWIPFANLYILAQILGELNLFGYEVPHLELVLPLAPVAIWIINFIPVIGQLVGLAYCVFMIMVLYNLFKKYRPDSAVLFTVFSCLGLFPIFIFIIRNDVTIN